MNFYDIKSIIVQLDKDTPNHLTDIATKIQSDMRVFWLESVYSSRSEYYEYTELLLNSARISEPQKIGNEWTIEIYIDDKEMHSNPAWYNLKELGISVGDEVSLAQVAERMDIIGRSDNIMDTMKEKWIDNKVALEYILNKLRSKYDVLG